MFKKSFAVHFAIAGKNWNCVVFAPTNPEWPGLDESCRPSKDRATHRPAKDLFASDTSNWKRGLSRADFLSDAEEYVSQRLFQNQFNSQSRGHPGQPRHPILSAKSSSRTRAVWPLSVWNGIAFAGRGGGGERAVFGRRMGTPAKRSMSRCSPSFLARPEVGTFAKVFGHFVPRASKQG